MKILQASILTIVMRYYLMMAVVITAFLLDFQIVGVLIALPIFLSAILGVVFWERKEKSMYPVEHQMPTAGRLDQAA